MKTIKSLSQDSHPLGLNWTWYFQNIKHKFHSIAMFRMSGKSRGNAKKVAVTYFNIISANQIAGHVQIVSRYVSSNDTRQDHCDWCTEKDVEEMVSIISKVRKIMKDLSKDGWCWVRFLSTCERYVTTCSVSLVYFTYVLQMLQPTVVSFHPYPDDQLLPLVQVEYLQPVNRANTKKTQSI